MYSACILSFSFLFLPKWHGFTLLGHCVWCEPAHFNGHGQPQTCRNSCKSANWGLAVRLKFFLNNFHMFRGSPKVISEVKHQLDAPLSTWEMHVYSLWHSYGWLFMFAWDKTSNSINDVCIILYIDLKPYISSSIYSLSQKPLLATWQADSHNSLVLLRLINVAEAKTHRKGSSHFKFTNRLGTQITVTQQWQKQFLHNGDSLSAPLSRCMG